MNRENCFLFIVKKDGTCPREKLIREKVLRVLPSVK
jgi:hypothetical protein